MIALAFTITLLATILAWCGQRKAAIYLFIANIFLLIGIFLHHFTGVIGLSL